MNQKNKKIQIDIAVSDTSITSIGPTTSATSSSHRNSYHLPKLTISNFNEDLLTKQTFEVDYNSAIGNSNPITLIEKFQFLRA